MAMNKLCPTCETDLRNLDTHPIVSYGFAAWCSPRCMAEALDDLRWVGDDAEFIPDDNPSRVVAGGLGELEADEYLLTLTDDEQAEHGFIVDAVRLHALSNCISGELNE